MVIIISLRTPTVNSIAENDSRGSIRLSPGRMDATCRPQQQAMPPRSYRPKPWADKSPLEGWCPPSKVKRTLASSSPIKPSNATEEVPHR
jgi:hypothetical protein